MPKSQFVDPKALRAPGKITFHDIPVNQYNKTIQDEKANYSNEDFVRIFRDISILREFETMINLIKTQGGYNGIEHTYPGPAHLSLGQEAAAVGRLISWIKTTLSLAPTEATARFLPRPCPASKSCRTEELRRL